MVDPYEASLLFAGIESNQDEIFKGSLLLLSSAEMKVREREPMFI